MNELEQIEKYCCDYYMVTMEEVRSSSIEGLIPKCRGLIFYLAFQFTKLTSHQIGEHYGFKEQIVAKARNRVKRRINNKDYEGEEKSLVSWFEGNYYS